jgi:hypothetical protein
LKNSAGVSAPGQEARSVRRSVMEVRAVPSRSGTLSSRKKWSNAVRWALTVFDVRRSTVFMWVL